MQSKLNYGVKRFIKRILLNIASHSCIINYKVRRFIYKKCGIKIGKNVFIGKDVYFDEINLSGITIGDNCFITKGTVVLSHFLNPKTRVFENGEVVIEKNVFIGVNTIISKPVKIGENTIIGAGSIVTKNIPSNVIAAGNPCKILKELGK